MRRYLCMFVIGCCSGIALSAQSAEESKFSGFRVRSNNVSVFLSWEVPDSAGVEQFIVERSKNGLQWKTLDTVSHAAPAYSYSDDFPAIGLNYYRVQASGGGKNFSSIIRRAYVGKIENIVTIYPNPV